ncbi:MAG: hypothetical protein AB8G22_07785 [Saprospiraceae bacterium]
MPKNDLLAALNKIAFRIQIAPANSPGHAVKLQQITQVLTKIEQVYQRFVAIELLKNETFSRAGKDNPFLIQLFQRDLELLTVDADYQRFTLALAPNILQKNQLIFSDTSMEIKRTTFKHFKKLLTGDLRSTKYREWIAARYEPQERARIFRPLFQALQPDYKLNVQNAGKKTVRTIVKPENKSLLDFYLPTLPKEEIEPRHKTVLAYVDINQLGDEIKFSSRHINKIYHIEELQYDTYPYAPSEIEMDDFKIEFHEKLVCEVNYQDEKYTISNKILNITATAVSREEVELGFNEKIKAFYSDLENQSSEVRETAFRITKAVQLFEEESAE